MRVVCRECGARVDVDKTAGAVVTSGGFADLAAKCPVIQARGPQTGQADYYSCPDLFDQVMQTP